VTITLTSMLSSASASTSEQAKDRLVPGMTSRQRSEELYDAVPQPDFPRGKAAGRQHAPHRPQSTSCNSPRLLYRSDESDYGNRVPYRAPHRTTARTPLTRARRQASKRAIATSPHHCARLRRAKGDPVDLAGSFTQPQQSFVLTI
jgi:hypothetical protein